MTRVIFWGAVASLALVFYFYYQPRHYKGGHEEEKSKIIYFLDLTTRGHHGAILGFVQLNQQLYTTQHTRFVC